MGRCEGERKRGEEEGDRGRMGETGGKEGEREETGKYTNKDEKGESRCCFGWFKSRRRHAPPPPTSAVAACSYIGSGGVADAVAAGRCHGTQAALSLGPRGWPLQLQLPRPGQSR